jgi:hypothetical protein
MHSVLFYLKCCNKISSFPANYWKVQRSNLGPESGYFWLRICYIFSSPPDECWNIFRLMPRSSNFTSFPVCYSLIIPAFDVVYSELMPASLNKPQIMPVFSCHTGCYPRTYSSQRRMLWRFLTSKEGKVVPFTSSHFTIQALPAC